MDENYYYVYEYFNKDNNHIFYVGKGRKTRVYQLTKRNKRFIEYINKNKNFDVRIIYKTLNESEAYKYEANRIKELKNKDLNNCNCNLMNTSFGLIGCSYLQNYTLEEYKEWCEKNSNSKKGTNNGMYNKKGKDAPNANKFIVYDDNGNKLFELKSMSSVKEFLKIKHHSSFYKSIRENKKYKGYFWKIIR